MGYTPYTQLHLIIPVNLSKMNRIFSWAILILTSLAREHLVTWNFPPLLHTSFFMRHVFDQIQQISRRLVVQVPLTDGRCCAWFSSQSWYLSFLLLLWWFSATFAAGKHVGFSSKLKLCCLRFCSSISPCQSSKFLDILFKISGYSGEGLRVN